MDRNKMWKIIELKYCKGDGLLLIISVFTCLLLFTNFIFIQGNIDWFNSDTAAQIIQVMEMKRKNTLFPNSWIDSTQPHLFSLPLLFVSMLTSDYLLARNLTQLLFAVVFLILNIWMIKIIFKNHSFLFLIPVVFSNLFRVSFTRLFFVYCDYLPEIFCEQVILTLFVTMLDDTYKIISYKRYIVGNILLFISCSIGLHGVEQIALPLLGSFFVVFWEENVKSDKIRLGHIIGHLAIVFLNVIFCTVLGTIFYKYIISKLFGVQGLSHATTFCDMNAVILHMQNIVKGIVYILELPDNASFFSIEGLQFFMRFAAFGFLILIFPTLSFKKYGQYSRPVKIMHIFTLINVIEMVLIALFSQCFGEPQHIRYFAHIFYLLSIISCNYIYDTYFKQQEGISPYVYTIFSCMVVIVVNLNWLFIPWKHNSNHSMREMTEFLEVNDLKFGYSSFQYANKNTALSNGNIQISSVNLLGGV